MQAENAMNMLLDLKTIDNNFQQLQFKIAFPTPLRIGNLFRFEIM